MNDFRDLKAIAEACQQHQPLRFMRSHGALYIRNDNGIVFDVHQNRSFPEFMAQNKDYADFVLAANPAAVLELIANYKSSQKHWENESNNVQALMAEVSKITAENAGLKTGYEAYERVNAELRAECEALKEKYEAARDRKNSITALQIENETLRDAAAVSAMRIKELDLLFGRYILAMRAAVIEDEHGKTETTGMDWIFNSLAGPGQLPPEDETDAQAYFDREIVAVDNGMQELMAFHDQRRKAMSKGASHD